MHSPRSYSFISFISVDCCFLLCSCKGPESGEEAKEARGGRMQHRGEGGGGGEGEKKEKRLKSHSPLEGR